VLSPGGLDTLVMMFVIGNLSGCEEPDRLGDARPAKCSVSSARTARLLASVMTPDEGPIAIEGLDAVTNPEQVRSQVSYMPQRFGLLYAS
jgi:hypothetical protein